MNLSPIGLYNSIARLAPEPSAPTVGAANTPRSFASVLADTARDALGTVQAGENAAMAGLAGEFDAHQVVAAMTRAELTLQATIAIRDKMVQAYQELMRMPV